MVGYINTDPSLVREVWSLQEVNKVLAFKKEKDFILFGWIKKGFMESLHLNFSLSQVPLRLTLSPLPGHCQKFSYSWDFPWPPHLKRLPGMCHPTSLLCFLHGTYHLSVYHVPFIFIGFLFVSLHYNIRCLRAGPFGYFGHWCKPSFRTIPNIE